MRSPFPSATRAPGTLSLLLLASAVASRAAEPGSDIDFLRDVRPILSAHCFKCHGPDEKTRKGGLRLDLREAAVAPAKSGAVAVVAGRPSDSALIQRINTPDEDEVMPPPSTKHPLSETQREILRRWVASGAEYRPHWAFVPPQRPAVPVPSGAKSDLPGGPGAGQVVNPIDAFIVERLRQEGLRLSPEADRATLARRVSLDLIGLPPTPEEADAFLKDTAPGAYERMVDRLLDSKAYGERWARRWMDLARYADTNGYEKDRVRSMWPWRDWLVRAFNADMPFDQFTVEQIAGDLLPGATQDQRIATGFHRNTMINEEGGIDPLEYRFHAMVDRVGTTATTWLGMTLACAQCHTHKYDPIQHREYYGFMAFLDNADEPEMDVVSPEIAARRKEIEQRIAQLESELPGRFPAEEILTYLAPPADRIEVESGATVLRLEDGSYRFGGTTPDQDHYLFEFTSTQTNIVLLNVEALADDALPSHGPGRAENGNFVLSEVEVRAAPLALAAAGSTTASDSLSADAASAQPNTPNPSPFLPIRIATASADFEQSGFAVARAIDGKNDTGWAISGQGAWNRNRRATFRFEAPAGFDGGTRWQVRLAQRHGGKHVLGRVRLSLGMDRPDPRPLETRRQEHFERRLEAWIADEAARSVEWIPLRPFEASSEVPVLTVEEDGTIFASSDQTKSDTYHLRFRNEWKGVTALRLEALPDDRLPRNGPGRVYYEGPFGDFFLSTVTLNANGQRVPLTRPSATFESGGDRIERTLDDDAQSGWSINGGQGRRHVAVFNLESPFDGDAFELALLFEKYYAAGLGRFRISLTTDPRGAVASAVPDTLRGALRKTSAQRSPGERQALIEWFVSVAPELAPERARIEQLRHSMPAYPTTLVMQERPASNPRTTRVRTRGEFLRPAEPVSAALPAVFAESLAAAGGSQPNNRLEFARWLVSRANPLTARVTVNRQWQAFFGRGLVRTMEDFGFQGELPSHPALLDWLAVEFMEQGWSLKRLHRLIALSATYRQSSVVTPDLLERDPENLLLARGPRVRIEGELVRDLALRASGLLSLKQGGPSVFPPQLPSITREGTYGPLEWRVSNGEDRYRRGLYTFAKRTAPYATFQTFDAPSGEACVARREVSNTPLQSLTLLNDAVFVEAAQALGTAAAAHDGSSIDRARFVFRRCLTREPESAELTRILEFYDAQHARLASGELSAAEIAGKNHGDTEEPATLIRRAAWTLVARALLNLDETVTRG